MGSICADLDPVQTDALATFGDAFGMSFQVVDDLLDIFGDPAKLGKPIGVDLVAGVYTYPVISTLGEVNGSRLRGIMGDPSALNIDEIVRD